MILLRDISTAVTAAGLATLLVCGLTCEAHAKGNSHGRKETMGRLVHLQAGRSVGASAKAGLGLSKRTGGGRGHGAQHHHRSTGGPATPGLIRAIHLVENPQNRACRHAAQGPLQIQPALVRDLNRRGYHFTLADRFSYARSAQMFAAYCRVYHARTNTRAGRSKGK